MRHPLVELPLDKFMPSDHTTCSKRPLSPTTPFLTPTKRRILSSHIPHSLHHSPSKPISLDIVSTPSSPARKLDFAVLSRPSPRKVGPKRARAVSSPKHTPVSRPRGTSKLQPSPTIAPGSSSNPSATICRSHLLESSSLSSLPSPKLIRREIPLFADRQSIHWPGFDIHVDTHITIPTSDTLWVAMSDCEIDDEKENARPKKRAGKRATLGHGKPIDHIKI